MQVTDCRTAATTALPGVGLVFLFLLGWIRRGCRRSESGGCGDRGGAVVGACERVVGAVVGGAGEAEPVR